MGLVNRSSSSINHYDQALHCLIALRKACIREDEPIPFNEYMYAIRDLYSQNHHVAFWKLIINSGISLIMNCECQEGVQTEESVQFTKEFFDHNLIIDPNVKVE
jgi:hypothetical protein